MIHFDMLFIKKSKSESFYRICQISGFWALGTDPSGLAIDRSALETGRKCFRSVAQKVISEIGRVWERSVAQKSFCEIDRRGLVSVARWFWSEIGRMMGFHPEIGRMILRSVAGGVLTLRSVSEPWDR